MDNSHCPSARMSGLVVQEMPNEVLVYDLDTNKAHCLNETAARVWKSCDGKTPVSDIAALFGSGSSSVGSEDLVWLAIDQLSENNLLEQELRADFPGQSRREVIKKIGLASMVAIPVIASLVAPPSVLATSHCGCKTPGSGECLTNGQPRPGCGPTCSASAGNMCVA